MTQRVVLVVDDHDDVHLLVQAALKRCRRPDLRLVSAKDGREALGMLADVRGIELVLSDVNMPYVTGPELILAMRARQIQVPVVLIGALMDAADGLGADERVEKDRLLEELGPLLSRFLPPSAN